MSALVRVLTTAVAAAGAAALVTLPVAAQSSSVLPARLVAVGIPGAGAIAQVGAFHAGSPIHDLPKFATSTNRGDVLDPDRILVAAQSNFGAPLAIEDAAPGAILSIDSSARDPLIVPEDFASSGLQAFALDGRVRLFTAQSPEYINGIYTPTAVTADQPPVSHPLGISINNAFGRLWFANAPNGLGTAGTESIVDPDGRPLANAPSKVVGGVYSGSLTNRDPELVPGNLDTAAVGTALLGKSPDGGGRAVFAVLEADGSLMQAHTEQGADGLAPTGTITPLFADTGASVPVDRAGVLFNWVPDPILYLADPLGNSVVAVSLIDDGTVFHVTEIRRIQIPELKEPVDLAPVVPEVANPSFSSNTTLAGGSDVYVANRGDGTLVRIRQDGSVVRQQQVDVPGLGILGAGDLNGIAVSRDGKRLWLTLDNGIPGLPAGAVVEVAAF
jgi:hypothetical protein